MRLNRYGRFCDAYRGHGWFVSFATSRGYFLMALRPLDWHLYWIRLPDRPGVTRLYVGPLEFELSRP